MGESYEDAGVSIASGDAAVERIRGKVRSTFRPEVIGDLGGFGGVFDFSAHGYSEPLLVSSTDGVGTKANVARAMGRFDTIGLDLVAMCVDDLVCSGAEPLFFLDYISMGRLDTDQIEDLVEGVADGCRQAGCALIGGELAEHPGAMPDGDFELVGFAVGVVERSQMITGQTLEPTDVLIALPSPGLRCNGYSMARRLMFDVAGRQSGDPAYHDAPMTVGEELLRPSVIYAPAVRNLLPQVEVKAVAHITGGGIPGNLVRVLPKGVSAIVDPSLWQRPHVFDELQRIGDVSDDEMRKVFNLGVGMIVAVPVGDAFKTIDLLRSAGHRAQRIGEIVAGDGSVEFE
jgi:phosphoribosylformylglycinamidine cyclo-ligase